MEITVNKCEHCGELFEDSKKYAKHLEQEKMLIILKGAFPKVELDNGKFVQRSEHENFSGHSFDFTGHFFISLSTKSIGQSSQSMIKEFQFFLVEQQVAVTFKFTSSVYVLEHGRIVLQGASRDLQQNEAVKRAYLGI
jgi:hypothetical protein